MSKLGTLEKFILILALIGLLTVLYLIWRLFGGIGLFVSGLLGVLGIRKTTKKEVIELEKSWSKQVEQFIEQEKELQKKREEELKAKEREIQEYFKK